jgi:ParB family chromosome partitioning protein
MSDRKERPLRLGRGLASLLGETDASDDAGAAKHILPVTMLSPSPFQPRMQMSDEALEELAASIRKHGILQPILVRPDPAHHQHYQIIAGERRWRAAQRAGLHDVPVHVRNLSDADALAAALIENLQRQDLNAIEEAEGLRRLSEEFGLTQEMVATSVGKSRSHVANTMRLLSLPKSVQHDVRRGALSAGHARALIPHPDPARAALAVLARGLNVRQTEALSKQVARPPKTAAKSSPLIDTTTLERELTAHLGLVARISFNGSGGQLSVTYDTLEQLEGLITLLKHDRTT